MDRFFSEFRRFAADDLKPIARADGGTSVPSLLPIMFAINTAGAMSVADSPSTLPASTSVRHRSFCFRQKRSWDTKSWPNKCGLMTSSSA